MAPMSRMDAQVMSGEVPRGLLEFSTGLNDAFFSLAQRTLRSMLGDGDLLTHLPALDPGTFTRRLLFADPVNRFGIWVLGWPPGCQTPVHNHHCSCAYGVYRGSIEEILYSVDLQSGAAVESGRSMRRPGYIGGAPRGLNLVHEMLNRGGETALSIHIYAYPPGEHTDSIDRRFTARPSTQET